MALNIDIAIFLETKNTDYYFNKNGRIVKERYNEYQRNTFHIENLNGLKTNLRGSCGITSQEYGIIIEISKIYQSSEILDSEFIGNNEQIKKLLDFKFVKLLYNGEEYRKL